MLSDSLALYQSVGDAEGGAQALTALGGRAYDRGRYAEAQQYWLAALDFWQVSGMTQRIVFALNNLGAVATCQGDWAAAERYLQQACHYQAQVAPENMSFLLGNLATTAYYRGDHNAAALLRETLVTTRREKRDFLTARCLYFLARIAREHDDRSDAWELLRASVSLYRSLEMNSDWGTVCELAAALFCDSGDAVHAAMLVGAAESLRLRAQTPRLTLDQPFYEALLHTLRQRLEPAQLVTLWRTGGMLPLEKILALLLDSPASTLDHAAAPTQRWVYQRQTMSEQR